MPQKKLVFNPYMPLWEYVPDGEPHVFDDRLYVYGSHDRQNGDSYCLEDYVVWSAPVDDLSQWRCEGVSYRRGDDRHDLSADEHLAAPDVACGPDGRYYLYYCAHGGCVCVAVADGPAGPFSYLGEVRAADGSGLSVGCAFDPAILSDACGNWLYYGYDISRVFEHAKAYGFSQEQLQEAMENSGAYCVELEDDMVTCKGTPVKIAPGAYEAKGTAYEGHAFFEASSIRHVGDRFYFVYSSTLGHELCYAISDRPDGGYRYGGTIVSNVDLGYQGNETPRNYAANTHGGMVEVAGQWYIFYHRHTHKRQYSRQACAEKIEILPDGSIPQVEITSCGLNDGPLPASGRYSAWIACGLQGPEGTIQITTTQQRRDSDPYFWQKGYSEQSEFYLANMQDGASCTYTFLQFDGCEAHAHLNCRGSFSGTVEIAAYGRSTAEPMWICSIPVEVSDSLEWKDCVADCSATPGTVALVYTVRGTGTLEIESFGFSD